MTRLLGPLMVLALAIAGSATDATAASPHEVDQVAVSSARKSVPTKEEWLADVIAAMKGSHRYVRDRAATKTDEGRLAVNFDIDNTVLATYYGGGAIPRMLKFARLLDRLGIAVLFNTGRSKHQRKHTIRQLRSAGFPVTALCLRNPGRTLAFSKQRCRDKFIRDGYTLIANVGNKSTDFLGDGYDKAYRLPNYGVMG